MSSCNYMHEKLVSETEHKLPDVTQLFRHPVFLSSKPYMLAKGSYIVHVHSSFCATNPQFPCNSVLGYRIMMAKISYMKLFTLPTSFPDYFIFALNYSRKTGVFIHVKKSILPQQKMNIWGLFYVPLLTFLAVKNAYYYL